MCTSSHSILSGRRDFCRRRERWEACTGQGMVWYNTQTREGFFQVEDPKSLQNIDNIPHFKKERVKKIHCVGGTGGVGGT